jgi:hypothetical protein
MRKNVPTHPTRPSSVPATVAMSAAKSAVGDAGIMFFLLRMTFWLGLVLVLLPFGSAQHTPAAGEVSASEALSAASATVGDLRGFCVRQPDACAIGSQMASTIGYRAQAGAKILYDVISEAMAPRETGSTGSVGTTIVAGAGSKPLAEKSAIERASQNTLTPTDLVSPWRGPSARKDNKHTT